MVSNEFHDHVTDGIFWWIIKNETRCILPLDPVNQLVHQVQVNLWFPSLLEVQALLEDPVVPVVLTLQELQMILVTHPLQVLPVVLVLQVVLVDHQVQVLRVHPEALVFLVVRWVQLVLSVLQPHWVLEDLVLLSLLEYLLVPQVLFKAFATFVKK